MEESRKALGTHRVSILAEMRQADADETGVVRSAPAGPRAAPPAGECGRATRRRAAASRCSSQRADDRLEFCVEDNGPGIDARDLPLIFEKFYRGKRGAGVRKGIGMGLAITRAILTAHGGGIEASSVAGQRSAASASGCRWWRKSRAGIEQPSVK